MRIDEPPSPCVWTVRYHETCFGPFCYDFRVHRITSAIDQNKRIQSAILSRCALIHTCSDTRAINASSMELAISKWTEYFLRHELTIFTLMELLQ